MNLRKLDHAALNDLDTRVVLDAVVDLVVMLSPAGKVEWVNAAAVATLGMSREELAAMDIRDLIAGDEGGWDEESLIGKVDLTELILGGVAKNLMVRVRTGGGEAIPMLLSASTAKVRMRGHDAIVLCVFKDISDLVAIEEYWTRLR